MTTPPDLLRQQTDFLEGVDVQWIDWKQRDGPQVGPPPPQAVSVQQQGTIDPITNAVDLNGTLRSMPIPLVAVQYQERPRSNWVPDFFNEILGVQLHKIYGPLIQIIVPVRAQLSRYRKSEELTRVFQPVTTEQNLTKKRTTRSFKLRFPPDSTWMEADLALTNLPDENPFIRRPSQNSQFSPLVAARRDFRALEV